MEKFLAGLAASMAVFLGACAVNKPWTLETGQHPQQIERQVSKTVRSSFLLYLPQGFDAHDGKKWPVIVFLHGSGERGTDLDKVKANGPPLLVQSQKDFPFIVVSPQAPDDTAWYSDTVIALLDELGERLPIDPDRVYLTGLSLGAIGAWAIAAEHPERFAAMAPISGYGETDTACRLKNLPIWAFHGAQDSVVKLTDDQDMVDAVKACGGNVKLTVYPGVDHDAWTQTYANPALYQWLLEHKRNRSNP